MLNGYVEKAAKMDRLSDGPFFEVLQPLADWLSEQGYTKLTGARWFKDICHFNCWFNDRGHRGQSVTEEHVRVFLKQCCRRDSAYATTKGKSGKRTLFPRLLALLKERQACRPDHAEMAELIPLEEYERNLVQWYGAAPRTVKRHRKYVEQFHKFAFGNTRAPWHPVEPRIVLDFVRQQARENPTKPRELIGSLRCYFRYLQLRGHDLTQLLNSLPHLHRRARPLPERLLSPREVKRWLAGFDRGTPEGLRNYAMALCLADLGIRTGDLTALRLGDLDWKNGTIRIPNSKTGRSFWLPLPARTGNAISKYLCKGRPENISRHVFLRHKTPINMPLTTVMIQRSMKRVARKQNIPWFGPHALRHTAATRMRSGGASLKEIADVLGHVDLASTMIYAKVDIKELTEIAMPWPEVRP